MAFFAALEMMKKAHCSLNAFVFNFPFVHCFCEIDSLIVMIKGKCGKTN
jgi:hypothetical protein